MSTARLFPWVTTTLAQSYARPSPRCIPRFFSPSSPISYSSRHFPTPPSLVLPKARPSSFVVFPTLFPKRIQPIHSDVPRPLWSYSSRSTSSLFTRAFSSTKGSLVRQTYYARGQGYGGHRPPGGSWWRNLKYRIDALPEMYVIYGLIGVNVAVFLVWQYAISSYQRFRDPSLYKFMNKNFVLNEANVMAGRLWTLVTSSFSHSSGSHILVNCLGLYFVAPAAASLIGSAYFLGLYLGGGVVASLTSLMYHRMRGDKWSGSEGASGAIYASLAFYGALFPNTTFLLFFVVPMPAWIMIGGIFAWDLFSAFGRPNSGVDSAGHIGGILAGVAAALAVRRGRVNQVWRGGPRWR